MQELFLYDKQQGLFKEILNKSSVMNGSYHVSPNHGNDLNTNNLETYIKDPANGLTDLKQYPICVCMTPRSRLVRPNGGTIWEEMTFNLYFLTTTFQTGDNQIKNMDADTKTSAHHIWYDWQDMKECAINFITVLYDLIRSTPSLRTLIIFDNSSAVFNRFTKFNNDRLTGVSAAFKILIEQMQCDQSEYAALNTITIPPLIIHSITDDQ